MADKIKPASGVSPQGSTLSGAGSKPKRESATGGFAGENASQFTHSGEDTVRLKRTGREAEELELLGLLKVVEENNLKFKESVKREQTPRQFCVMPRLSGMTVSEAASKLMAAGLRISKITRQQSAQAAGYVISHIPGEGENIEKGHTVHVILSE